MFRREGLRHHLQDSDERRGLPVTLGAKPEPVGHEPLCRDSRELRHAVQILEGVREGMTAVVVEERAQSGFDPSGRNERVAPRATRAKLCSELVLVGVVGEECLDDLGRSGTRGGHQIADAVAVDREPELHLRLDLVSVGHCNVTHVVAEAHDTQRVGLVPPCRSAHPGADALADARIIDMAGHGLPPNTHPRQ